PFLVVDCTGVYSVLLPAFQRYTSGISRHHGATPGRALPRSRFYIAQPGRDTAITINSALAHGKNLILTTGIYDLTEPIRVTRPSTVVYGLGFATLHAIRGTAAMTVADVDGILISGLLFDAGETRSPVLLEVGPNRSHVP